MVKDDGLSERSLGVSDSVEELVDDLGRKASGGDAFEGNTFRCR